MKDKRNGQAVLLLLLALALFLLGAVGLAVESSHFYTHRQLAQDAADAAAQAAITSVYTGSNTGSNAFGASDYTCTNGTDLTTPCFFARQHGFGAAGSVDVVDVDFPTSIPGVGSLDTDTAPAAVGVTISRPITTGLLQFVGGQLATVRARGVAAILDDISPVPILVMHPSRDGALAINGNPTIKICGGPVRSIQINSSSETSFEVAGGGGGSSYIDLTQAGPGGTSGQNPTTCPGSGGEFGNHGGPFDYDQADSGAPTNIGPITAYRETVVVDDPLSVAIPVEPVPSIVPIPPTQLGVGSMPGAGPGGGPCQRAVGRNCTIHYPGTYDGGLKVGNGPGGNASNGGEMTLFYPGVYYITNGGFEIGSNGIAHMMPCTPGFTDPISHPLTDCGMIVYLRPTANTHIVEFNSNSGQIQGNSFSQTFTTIFGPVTCTGNCLLGPPLAAPFWNVLFMVDRTVSTRFAQTHQFQGGGGLTLAGTLYFTNAPSPLKRPELEVSPADFQTLSLQGTPGSTTQVVGQIIVDALQLGGNATINMTLNPNAAVPIRKLALIR